MTRDRSRSRAYLPVETPEEPERAALAFLQPTGGGSGPLEAKVHAPLGSGCTERVGVLTLHLAGGTSTWRAPQDGTIASRRMDVESGEERVKAVLNEINGRNLERSVGAWLGSQLKRRGWGRWRAAEALGVRLPKLSAWLDGSADPTERERERITNVFGPGLP